MCGALINPWFEVCYQCYNPALKSMEIPKSIAAKEFMEKMRIDS